MRNRVLFGEVWRQHYQALDSLCLALSVEERNHSFLDEELNWFPYPEEIEKYGEPKFDECFAYVPILGLGGPEKVENLSKVKLFEHIYLITQFMGPIE